MVFQVETALKKKLSISPSQTNKGNEKNRPIPEHHSNYTGKVPQYH